MRSAFASLAQPKLTLALGERERRLAERTYAAVAKSSASLSQPATRFHLGKIWASKPSFPASIGRK